MCLFAKRFILLTLSYLPVLFSTRTIRTHTNTVQYRAKADIVRLNMSDISVQHLSQGIIIAANRGFVIGTLIWTGTSMGVHTLSSGYNMTVCVCEDTACEAEQIFWISSAGGRRRNTHTLIPILRASPSYIQS